ncbi:MAG: hypothetical protein AAGA95_19255, partial [Pseudomonadota bacterium]
MIRALTGELLYTLANASIAALTDALMGTLTNTLTGMLTDTLAGTSASTCSETGHVAHCDTLVSVRHDSTQASPPQSLW